MHSACSAWTTDYLEVTLPPKPCATTVILLAHNVKIVTISIISPCWQYATEQHARTQRLRCTLPCARCTAAPSAYTAVRSSLSHYVGVGWAIS